MDEPAAPPQTATQPSTTEPGQLPTLSPELVQKVQALADELAQGAGDLDLESRATVPPHDWPRRSLDAAREAVLAVLEAEDPLAAAFRAMYAVQRVLPARFRLGRPPPTGRRPLIDLADELVLLATPEPLRARRAVMLPVWFFNTIGSIETVTAVVEVNGQWYGCDSSEPDHTEELGDLIRDGRTRPVPRPYTALPHFSPNPQRDTLKHLPVTFPLPVHRTLSSIGVWVAAP